ncbi:kinetochore-associated protein 1 [Sergentomyia squamirostris]
MWSDFRLSSNDEVTISNILSANGLFEIASTEEVIKYPRVKAAVRNAKIFVSVDQCILLIENEDEGECKILNFPDALVDCAFLSESGRMIVCCLSNGDVNGFSITGTPLLNLKVDDEDIQEERTFIGISSYNQDLYIMCTNGRLYKLSAIEEDKSVRSFNDETLTFDETITSNASLCKISSRKFFNEIISFTMMPDMLTPTAVFTDSTRIYIYSSEGIVPIPVPAKLQGVKKLILLEDCLLGLCSSGDVIEICPFTGMIFNFSSNTDLKIDDLILLESSEEKVELLVITKASILGPKRLVVVDYPSMKCIYDLDTCEHCWLVDQQKSSMGMYYLVGNTNEDGDIPSEIEMKVISETLPIHRLKKLITSGRLEEAEQFAVQLGLSQQPIYEFKINRIVPKITACRNIEKLRILFNEFLELLTKIDDSGEMLMLIFDIEIPDRQMTSEFLHFVRGKFTFDHCQDIRLKIAEYLRRIDTLNLMDPHDSILEWRKFVQSQNLVKTVIEYFSTNMSNACLIWSRHSAHLIPSMDTKNLMKILNSIPTSIEPLAVIQWLRHFTPSLLQIHPQFMPTIIDWSIDRIRFYENSHAWRESVLEICKNVLDVFQNLHFIIADSPRQYESSIRALQDILYSLEDLQMLKNEYNLTIGLQEYRTNNVEESVFKLLICVQTDKIQNFINEYIYPKFMELNKSPIDSLVKYINFLVTYKKQYWQERAVIVIQLIPDEDNRLQCALNVLSKAPVPFSPVLTPLIKYSILNHNIAAEIRSIHDKQIVKIIKQKYQCPQDSSDDYTILICRILKVNNVDLWSDVKSLIQAVPQIEKLAYFLCLNEITKQGNFDMAIHILSELGETRQEVLEYVAGSFISMIREGVDRKLEKNYIQMLNILKNKAHKSLNSIVEEINNFSRLKSRFENTFNDLKMDDLQHKDVILHQGIEAIVNNFVNYGKDLVTKLWNNMKALTDALQMDQLDGLIKFTESCSNLHISCNIAFNILTMIDISSLDCENILNFCCILLVQLTRFDVKKDNFDDPLVFPLIYQLLAKVLSVTNVHFFEAKELISWTRIVTEFYENDAVDKYYRDHEKVSKELVEILQKGQKTREEARQNKRLTISIPPPSKVASGMEIQTERMYVLKCITVIMKIIIDQPDGVLFGHRLKTFSRSQFEDNTSLRENSDSFNNETDINISVYIQHLFKLKMYSTLYNIGVKLQRGSQIFIIPQESVNMFHVRMVRASLMEKDFNLIECHGQLISCTSPKKILNSLDVPSKNDTFKLRYHTLMETYFASLGNSEREAHERENRMKYQVLVEIKKSKPDFDLNIEHLTLTQTLKEISTVPIDMESLRKIFQDFSWKGDYQEVLVAQLQNVLSQQELKFTVINDTFGREVIKVLTSVEDILKLCRPYLDEIVNKKLLITRLITFLTSMNSYFYEMYLAVIEILTEFESLPADMEKWKHILDFLMHKMVVKRRTRPTQIEIDAWTNVQVGGIMPKIAKYRFPFQIIIKSDLRNVLGEEIRVDTCEEWFPLIKIHAIHFYKEPTVAIITDLTENFCMTAVKNSINEYKTHTEMQEDDTWQLKPMDNALMKSIVKLTRFMSTEWKIFMVLYYVTNYTADGVDQVDAAYECWKYALKHEKKLILSEKVTEPLAKIKRKYPMMKVQHLLHVHKLNQENLLALASNPVKLIHALYMHESLLQPQPPNISYVVEEIAELHKLDLTVIQENLLIKWLSVNVDTNETCPDDTLVLDNMHDESIVGAEKNTNEEDVDACVKRAQCILLSWPIEKAVQFLIQISHQNPQNCESELKIYDWVIGFHDDDAKEWKSVIADKNYVQVKVISDLKKLGMTLPPERYNAYDKVTLLKKIWQTNGNNPTAAHAMALICLEFNINEPRIWDQILKRMVHFGMNKELMSVVNFLTVKQELLETEGLKQGWEWLIKAPFERATCVRTANDTEDLCRALTLLQTCPVTTKLDLVHLANLCEHIDQIHMAAIVMMFAANDDRDTIKENVIKHKSRKMQSDLENLELYGILPVFIKNAISEIFNEMD